MAKKKIIKVPNNHGIIITINTKRLDAIYRDGREVFFLFKKNDISTGVFDTTEAAEKVRKEAVDDWLA